MWTPRGLQEGFGSLVAHRYLRPLRTTLQQIAIGLLRFESSGGATASVTSDITTIWETELLRLLGGGMLARRHQAGHHEPPFII